MGFISSTIIEFIATEVIERGASKASKILGKRGRVRDEELTRKQSGTFTQGERPKNEEGKAMTERETPQVNAMQELTDEELEEVSGGYIHQAEDGLYDVFDARGNVLARCSSHKEAIQTCRSLGELTHHISDESYNSTYADLVRKSKEEQGFL